MSTLRSLVAGFSLAGIFLLMICSADIVSRKKAALKHPLPALPGMYFSEIEKDSQADLIVPHATAIADTKIINQSNVNPLNISLNEALVQVAKIARLRHIEPSALNELVRQSQMPADASHREYQVNLLTLNLCLDLYVTNKANRNEDLSLTQIKKSGR
ncbi:potassium-transporting ATPase subunit C [Undibacterium sp. SXout11W]|uniref:potassium-transporting ATPase subunit C n=1 Tax=Undibacterium sp. SXout11W TaxID=3413050 RepID=UPI003BF0F889